MGGGKVVYIPSLLVRVHNTWTTPTAPPTLSTFRVSVVCVSPSFTSTFLFSASNSVVLLKCKFDTYFLYHCYCLRRAPFGLSLAVIFTIVLVTPPSLAPPTTPTSRTVNCSENSGMVSSVIERGTNADCIPSASVTTPLVGL